MQRYKEIFYGLFIGLGGWVIDAVMHVQMHGQTFWATLLWPEATALFYRLLFVAFGLALGWSLWKKNKRERDFRQLAEILQRFHKEIVSPAFLIHGKLQVLLTREDMRLSPAAEEIVRFVYEQSQIIQSLAKERLPAADDS